MNGVREEKEPVSRVRKGWSEAHARLAAIVETSDDAIIAQRLDGTITDWNAGAEAIYGYTPAEIVGQPVSLLIPREQAAQTSDFLARLAAGERVAQFETIRLHKDGHRLDMSVTITPLRDARDVIVGRA